MLTLTACKNNQLKHEANRYLNEMLCVFIPNL
jgi:hypothetical protein